MRDVHIKDLVVVDYQDIPDWGSDAYTEDGYVYTWQSNGVKLLKHDQDMNIQGGSGLLWYLRKLDNGMYNLIDVDSYIHQGYNSATIRELSLTANGDEILEKPTCKFGEQGQPISDDEYDAFESKWLEVTKEYTYINEIPILNGGTIMPRPKGSKNAVRTKKANIDYAAIVAEKTAAKEQIETEIAALSDNISTLKEQLKSKKSALKVAVKELSKAEAKKVAAEKKAAEESKKAEAESVLKKLLASGMSADEIVAKLQ